ncbi:HTH-type transcriptional regulator MalT [Baekduia alba]|uniref:LuxR C-terminal-related transcriptional regulator n=1 Tax=Baekduia alba TaxID=2997333 RepID=UPI002341C688|nr:LuxR C-terminal-related transcriptional regulator [Baekduia alba]WCB95167.1 HTH-type transcriptional regulator MalT [Baekduia alba]
MPGPSSALLVPAGVEPSRAISFLRAAPPSVPKRVEPRVRLLRRLLATAETRAVVLSAPAGYGKTALLEAWAAVEARPVVVVGLGRTADAVDGAAAELEAAVEDLRAAAMPAVLVVDDADVGDGVFAARALAAAERELPACVTLVLSGRGAPPEAFGRLRSAWPVLELGADDLAMTHNEAAALIAAAGLELDGRAVATLMARTEGWPSGLRLAIVALGAQGDLDAAVAGFGGDDRVVADYLRGEILADLPADRLAFLTNTAVLGALSGPVCDAVLERHDSGRILFDLGRSPVPLRSTDRSEEHFRLHPLVIDMLRAELHRADPEGERALHARAATYYEEAGQIATAIDHAIAGGDFDRAAELLWGIAPSALFDGRAHELQAWLARIGDTQVGRRPALALTAALTALADGDRDQVERWVAAARRAAGPVASGGGSPMDAAAPLLRAAVAPGDAAALRDRADEALAALPEGSPWRAVCCLLRGIAHGLLGDRAAAQEDLEEGVRRGAVVMPAIEALCLAQLALHALLEGDADEGAVLAERARTRIDARGLDEPMTRGFVCAVSAFARAHRGRVEEARGDVTEARSILGARDALMPWYDAQGRLALARAQLRLSDVAAARALTAEAARGASRIPDAARLRAWIDDAWGRADTFAVQALAGPGSLTTAELRVLRFLPSHLSFREIAERLQVSSNTVKTQAHAVYRKLDASSRSMAVERARAVGILDQ